MYRMFSGGGDECILVTCGAIVLAFNANFVEAYFDSLLFVAYYNYCWNVTFATMPCR